MSPIFPPFFSHGSSDDAPRIEIEEDGQVQPARPGGNGREISGQEPIQRGRAVFRSLEGIWGLRELIADRYTKLQGKLIMSKVLRRFLQRQRLLRVRIITSALVGSGTPEVLGLILLKKFGKKYDLAISELSYSEDVLDLARRQTIDVFIPVLNNIMINHDLTGYPRDRVETVLQVIAFLKRTYDIPSIVLAGWWPQDWDIGQKIKEAGGNCFFSLPPETDLLVAAVQDALDGKSMWRTNV